jgi:hypothetical protein
VSLSSGWFITQLDLNGINRKTNLLDVFVGLNLKREQEVGGDNNR